MQHIEIFWDRIIRVWIVGSWGLNPSGFFCWNPVNNLSDVVKFYTVYSTSSMLLQYMKRRPSCVRSARQEAELSQTGRATSSVVEILKCSLGSLWVTKGHWKCYHSKALVRFPIRISQQLHVRPYVRFDTAHERDTNPANIAQEPRFAASLGCSRAGKPSGGQGSVLDPLRELTALPRL